MKTISLLLVMGWVWINTSAQTIVNKEVEMPIGKELELDLKLADSIELMGWEQQMIRIVATVNINEGKDNEKFVMDFDDFNQRMVVQSDIKDLDKISKQRIIYDEDSGEKIHTRDVDLEIWFQIWLPKQTSLKLKTINGDVKASGLTGKMRIKSISGDVDITLPGKMNASLTLKSITGNMYSDLNLKSDRIGHDGFSMKPFHCDLNDGGQPIELESISGNIYIRKQ